VTDIPFETTIMVRDSCLCLAVQRAARALARHFDDALRPLDLTNGQFSLLMALNRPRPPGIAPVAQLLAMDRTTLTAALKPLARRGLLKITVDPEDRRGRRLSLTRKGKLLLRDAVPIWKRHHHGIEKLLASPDRVRNDLRVLAGLNGPFLDAGSGSGP
jgi:DNA-binding MarR family transcriptional regulator